jgi:SAM-dependent methyltransferase
MDIRESYDSAADAYASHLASELAGKPLDRHLLNRFAEAIAGKGTVADLGCGPGHIARYLHDRGVHMIGVDLSPEMIRNARQLNPTIEFSIGDMRALDIQDASLSGVVAFYAIVHFRATELEAVFCEVRRVLAPGGLALLAFHAGQEVVHVDDLFGAPVDLDFRFHWPPDVIAALGDAGFSVIEHLEREPYDDVEYPSRRCYLLAKAPQKPAQS